MAKLTKNDLFEALAQYGYELRQPARAYNAEDVLLNLVKDHDSRLLEGFPVAFRNVLSSGYMARNGGELSFYKKLSEKEKTKLLYLLILTYLLFKLYGEDKAYLARLEDLLSKVSSAWRKNLSGVEQKFNHSEPLKLDNVLSVSTERLKTQFRNYILHSGSKGRARFKMDMELELLLSEFFTPRQKDLLKKRLSGEKFSKTEREYFYRVVNKRLRALSNEHLYQFAKSAGAHAA